jgi:hypothetical protein
MNKYDLINAIIDEAAEKLKALDVPYFISAIDRNTQDPDGGKVFVSSDVRGADMQQIFKHAFPLNKDIAALGLWVGNEIMRRNKDANVKWVKAKKIKNGKQTN